MEKENATQIPATAQAAANAPKLKLLAPTKEVYGTEDIEKLLDVAAEAIQDYKEMQPGENLFQKAKHFTAAGAKFVFALDSLAKVVPQVKDLDDKELETLIEKYMGGFGVTSKVTAIVVVEGGKIIGSGFRIFKAIASNKSETPAPAPTV